MRKPLIFIFMSFCLIGIFGQQKDTTNMIRFTSDFKFQDGVFVNFEQVKNNAPLAKSKILTTIDFNDDNFFTRLLNEKKIYYYDALGMKQEIESKNIWGFARNGNIYIKVGNEFNRITYIGSISHFIANITNTANRMYDPYMYNYYNPYNYYNYQYGMPYITNETKELKQFILDFETGKVMDFDVKSMEALLVRDPKLFDEYAALSGRKQKQLKFLYLRKFNERNPLYFPDHSKTPIK